MLKKNIEYTNRRGQVYYLYQGVTKTGKPKYYFSMSLKEEGITAIPDGYEIYENPNAQIFLRKKEPALITDTEEQIVTSTLKTNKSIEYFIVDVKKQYITVYTAEQKITCESDSWLVQLRNKLNIKRLERFVHYSAEMRFILSDANARLFVAERFCYRGSVDDWIQIGFPDKLHKLVEKFIPHLGRDSFYELY